MNLSHPKNLETLRGEYDKLGMRIARLAFIRATLFVLFVFFLASAFQAISSSNASEIVGRIRKLQKITEERPKVDAFLTAIYFPDGGIHAKESTTAEEEATGEEESPRPVPEETPVAPDSAMKEQLELEAKLTRIADEAFTFAFKAPLLGTDIKLDLRIWGFILIFCFIFWEVHLFVQRHKLRTLQGIGGILTARAPADATVMDHLLFDREDQRPAAFARHPAQFEFVVSFIGGIAMLIYLSRAGYEFWQGAEASTKHQLVEVYAFVVTYAIAYGAYVKRQINAEAAKVDGFVPVTSYPARLLAWVSSRLVAYFRRVWPEVNLVTGTTMVIGTLWLLVGAPFGCDQRTGWEYLNKPGGWLVGPITGIGAFQTWHNYLIAALYGIGLAIAGITLILVTASLLRRRHLRARRVTLSLATVTTVLALFFLTELTIGQALDLGLYVMVLIWAIPVWIWYRFGRSKHGLSPERARARRWLFHWYAPQAGIAAIVTVGTLFETYPLIGVPVFVCGLAMAALGYWRLAELGSGETGDAG